MPLTSGTLLGPYEILDPIGAGGMGEVYRARDRRLDRMVAIKVLPPHLSSDPDLRERFEREARAVSSLNHPHICALYDIGEAPSLQPSGPSPQPSALSPATIQFLVMEYLEGHTLADRLQKGPLPIEEALRYAIEIGSALDSAHRRGIVHRDLKPGNVMLTATGTKLLDFGLAKSGVVQAFRPAGTGGATAEGPHDNLTAGPTAAAPLTMAGTILGTLQYMSPEQLEGRDADARTDIFAFGALLYEMVTGRRAFQGKSQVSLIAAIVDHDPPPISSLKPVSPALLDHLVKTCLAKDPERRWQTIADVVIQLKLIAEGGIQLGASQTTSPRSRRRRLAGAASVLVAAVSAAVVATALFIGRQAPDAARIAFELTAPQSAEPLQLALSPDGSRLVATARSDKGSMLWLRALEHVTAQTMIGTDWTSSGTSGSPFWSPDGRSVAFFADGKLKKVDISGAPPQVLCGAASGYGGAWNRDGVIVFAPNAIGPLFRVSAAGGVPAQVTDLDATRLEIAHRRPAFLPDGRHFIYLAVSSKPDDTAVFVGSLDSKERKHLVAAQVRAAFAPPDYLLFMRENTLMAQRLDLKRFELQGDPVPVPVAEQVGTNAGNGAAGFTVSENGRLALRSGNAFGGESQLSWLDRTGKATGTIGGTAAYREPALSPDLQRIAVDQQEAANASRDIWILDSVRGTKSRFTFDPADDRAPIWSPDGTRIVFTSNRAGGVFHLYQKNAGGAGTEELLLKSEHNTIPEDWSADGRFILYRDTDQKTKADLWVLPVTGDRKPQPILRSEFNEQQGRFSPDGRWIAYVSDESGGPQVYVQSFPVSGTKYQISTQNGYQPRWRADGKELFFVASLDAVASVEISVAKDGTLRAGVPKALFPVRLQTLTLERNSWDVAPDGQRFLINSTGPADATTRSITVVVNWMAGIASAR